MTIDELIRLMESKRRVYESKLKEKANFDYTLADLIGRSVARVYNSSNHMPDISEAYPSLFSSDDLEEQKSARQAELSALRFKQFAHSFNKNFSGGGKGIDE